MQDLQVTFSILKAIEIQNKNVRMQNLKRIQNIHSLEMLEDAVAELINNLDELTIEMNKHKKTLRK